MPRKKVAPKVEEKEDIIVLLSEIRDELRAIRVCQPKPTQTRMMEWKNTWTWASQDDISGLPKNWRG